MSELQAAASTSDPYLVFDGKRLHKKAFTRKGKLTDDHAVLLAGVLKGDINKTQIDVILSRMRAVKKAFSGRIQHYCHNWCVENARRIGMVMRVGGGPVQSYNDILEELESNPTMESFQRWYNIYYREWEVRSNGKKETEEKIMRELNVKYSDNTTSGGCIGELMGETVSKMLESVQKRSREKQQLHLTKSRPGKENGITRRMPGDYFIIRSDTSGKIIGWDSYNVSKGRPRADVVVLDDTHN
jgi:hypothetical protein